MVLAILVPEGVLLTRLVVDVGVYVTEMVTGPDRLTLHVTVYANVLRFGTLVYPTLLVVRLSV